MTWISGGTFAMGSEDFYVEERPVHRVTVDGFWMDERPVTAADFRRFEPCVVNLPGFDPEPDSGRGLYVEFLVSGKHQHGNVDRAPVGQRCGRERSAWWYLPNRAGSRDTWSRKLEQGHVGILA